MDIPGEPEGNLFKDMSYGFRISELVNRAHRVDGVKCHALLTINIPDFNFLSSPLIRGHK